MMPKDGDVEWLKGLLSFRWLRPRPLELPPQQLTADTEYVVHKVEETKKVVDQTAEDVKRHTLEMRERVHDLEERIAFYEQARR